MVSKSNNKQKNIWILSQYTGSPYHGMNYRAYYLAKEFVKKGHTVTIFAGSYSHLFMKIPKIKGSFTKEEIDGINYIWVKTPKYKSSKSIMRVFSMLVFMWRLLFFKTNSIAKPDEIIISSLSLFPVINAYIWSKIFKIGFIFEIRDIWPLTLVEVGGFSKYHPLVVFLGFFEKFGYKKAKAVVSVLPKAYLHTEKRGMAKEKFNYIPNGVLLEEVSNFEPISKEVEAQIPKDKFIVGYLGTLGIANALDTLLKSAKIVKDNKHIHFLLVGKGDEKALLEAYVLKNMLSNVTFIDAIAKIQVQSILSYFDVCYISAKKKEIYKYGVSPNKLFDYMYASKPILYAIESGENLVDKAHCGLSVKAEDKLLLSEKILEVSSILSKELDKMGANAKDYVIEHHSYETLVQSYIQLMEKR
ncbi:MAG: glycosyltransferase family 4 protein [Sulfurovum sp.]